MRISELSRRTGVPIPTIKYYLRAGLLPPGRATAATQAEYDEAHVRRLGLVRALLGVRGLTVNATKEVLEAVAEHQTDLHQVLGLVLGARPVAVAEEAAPTASAESDVEMLLREMGWHVTEHAPAREVITETVRTMRSLGLDYDWRSLVPYAELADRAARMDLDQLQDLADPLQQAERALLLTVVLEPALLALRRLAQEAESAKRFAAT